MKTEFVIYDYDNDPHINNGTFINNNVLTSRNGIINMNEDLDYKLEFIRKEIFDEYDVVFKLKYHEVPYVFEHENITGSKDNPKIFYCYYTLHNFITNTVNIYIDIIDKIKFLLKCCNVRTTINRDYSKIVHGNVYIPIRFYSVYNPTPTEVLIFKQQEHEMSKLKSKNLLFSI